MGLWRLLLPPDPWDLLLLLLLPDLLDPWGLLDLEDLPGLWDLLPPPDLGDLWLLLLLPDLLDL
ncbi:hypothetical protein D3Z58_17735 [Clostridiaceae bacterium]|nr:hypothetical protein [Clostridiaceae bacterium]